MFEFVLNKTFENPFYAFYLKTKSLQRKSKRLLKNCKGRIGKRNGISH